MSRVGKVVLLSAVLVSSGGVGLVFALASGKVLSDGSTSSLVEIGLSVAILSVHIGASILVGSLALSLWGLVPGTLAHRRASDLAAWGAGLTTLFSALASFLSFLVVSQTTPSFSPEFGHQWAFYLTQVGLGQAWLTVTIVSAVTTLLCVVVTNQTALFFVGLLSLGTVIPLALQGHAASAAGHAIATNSLTLHVVFVAVWFGGLVALSALLPVIDRDERLVVAQRLSTLALVSFIVVAGSGILNAAVRIGSWASLATPYGAIVVVKVIALGILGVFGAWHRGYFLTSERRGYGWFIAGELGIMAVAAGLASGLARTATPVSEDLPSVLTPAQILTGEPLPPPLDFTTYVTAWSIDPLWLAICAFGIFFYVAGYARLRRRGDTWPLLRVVFWVCGMLLLFWITNGGVNAYEHVLFSQHMLAHMSLGMVVPLLLVPAAPVTLAMRAIRKRQDGSRGAREWILLAVHSRYARILANPIFATVNFVGSLWLFYYTGILRWAITDHLGHEWMIMHFLLAGYLFVQSLIGIDPGVNRLPYPFRLLQLLTAMTVHAFFGLTIMSGQALLLADWYGAMGREWGPTPMEDQMNAGAIAWSVGEIPNVILATVIAIQWSRNDARVARRLDRQALRDNDAELEAYNEMLRRVSRDTSG